jgi:hypothetical protein
MDYIDIVFDGPPSPEGARFVEVEGASISASGCSGRMDIGRFASLRKVGGLQGRSCWRQTAKDLQQRN